MSKSSPEKILVIFLSGIGNLILFLPTLRAVRNRFPRADVTLCVKEKVVFGLIPDTGLVNKIIDYPQKEIRPGNIISTFLMLTKQRRERYDVVITTFDAKGWKLAAIVKIIGGRYNIGFRSGKWYDRIFDKVLYYDLGLHELERHLLIAHDLEAAADNKTLELSIAKKDREFAESVISPNDTLVIGMHPGSSNNLLKKRWMPESFAKLADLLSQRYNAKIIILGGPDEAHLSTEVSSFMNSRPVSLAGKTTIGEAAAIIEKCNLFVSNDSGLMHISAAVGTPTVAIFGPTDPVKNSPVGENHVIVRKDIPCSPCDNYDKEGCNNTECLNNLSVEEVANAVEGILISLGMENTLNYSQ